ncbi:MAG TPA: GNAT family N-acetyltransferase [Gemmatimonadaceae bacterium]|nr:GNAT family N-acetyltransferase [Gemmatimonadaceae bacterium]
MPEDQVAGTLTSPAVLPYRPEWRAEFERLNRQWLEDYELMEESDLVQLRDPEASIRAGGGEVYFLLTGGGDTVVGTFALRQDDDDARVLELCKLAVDRAARGRGYGDLLVRAAIAAARERSARRLYLFSTTRLAPALALYRKHGFALARQGAEAAAASGYATCDVEMVLELER